MELEDKKHFKNYFTAWIVIICLLFCAIIFFIFIPNANALEVRNFELGSNGFYGYRIPERTANQDTNNYVDLVIQSGTDLEINKNFKIFNRYCDTNIQGNCAYTGTEIIQYIKTNANKDTRLTFGYHPADLTTNIDDMLISGDKLYYDGIYSYDFTIEIWSDKTLGITNDLTFGINFQNNTNFVYTSNSWTLLENYTRDNYNYRKYLVRVGYNNGYYASAAGKFLNVPLSPDMNNTFYGTGAIRPQTASVSTNFGIQGTGQIYYVFSRPYNIIYWSNEQSLTCSTTCWTEEDTFNSDEWGPKQQITFNNSFFSNTFFRDYGLGGVFTHLIDKFKYYLNSYNENSCHNLNITIMGKQIQIPCGKTLFWGRNDISIFANIWSVFWSGFVAFFIARKIYSNLMVLFNDDFKFKDVVDL